MRKVAWREEPASDGPDAREAAEFARSLRFDMSETWEDHVVEALSMLQFGFAPMEIVYKRRLGQKGLPYRQDDASSAYDDGKIGVRRLPLRGQESVSEWFFDQNGQITGMTQQPWSGALIDIPIEKLLLYRPTQHKNNPEGRACTLDTKVRTPRGWITMGDLRVGDRVYDERGVPCNVVAKSEIFRDRPVYEFEFATGHTVRTDACHSWRVSNTNDRTYGRSRDMTTEQIAREFERLGAEGEAREIVGIRSEERFQHRRAKNISCGLAPVLQGDEVPLPLDPYVLGYWLGNGTSTGTVVTCHSEDAEEIAAIIEGCGLSTEIKTEWSSRGQTKHIGIYDGQKWNSDGLRVTLRMLGLLGDKHVPKQYLTASPSQRLALLQGLMDSDGWSPGQAARDIASTFANTNPAIIEAVSEIARTLGGQPRTRVIDRAGEIGGVVNGRPVVAAQTCYEVRFVLDLPVHRLTRKLNAQVRRKTHRIGAHFIRAVRRVENADTVCIEVDSPSHLFLVGEGMVPTCNSILRTAYRPFYFMKRIEELEAILFERMGGLPLVRVPTALLEAAAAQDPKAVAALNAYKALATNVRADEQMGVVIPSDTYRTANGDPSPQRMYEFELKTPDTSALRVDSDKVIHRYNVDILKSVLADFIDLGHQARGTQNLAISKVDMFYTAIEGWLRSMASVQNRYLLPRVWALNAMPMDTLPAYVPDLPMRVDLDVLGKFILSLSQSGMALFPDRDLENYIRGAAGMPDAPDTDGYDPDLGDDVSNRIEAQNVDPATAGDPDAVVKHVLGLAALARRRAQRDGARPYGVRSFDSIAEGDTTTPLVKLTAADLDRAALAAREPTENQRVAGNYPKGHVNLHGLRFTIETPRGAMRRGTGADGRPWTTTLPAHYGYVRGSGRGADGTAVDAYLGPDPASTTVFVVDQLHADTGEFDEHKCLLCWSNLHDALNAYRMAFSDGRGDARIGAVHRMSVAEFRRWLAGDTTRSLSPVVGKAHVPSPTPSPSFLINGHAA